jgi:hypothetical protein
MRRSGLATALYVTLVFLSGTVFGIFGYRLYTAKSVNATTNTRPSDYRKQYVQEMTQRLHLTSEQISQLSTILDETKTKYDDEHERSKRQLAQFHDEQTQKIKEILTPAQVPEYMKFRAEREKAREKRLREKAAREAAPDSK